MWLYVVFGCWRVWDNIRHNIQTAAGWQAVGWSPLHSLMDEGYTNVWACRDVSRLEYADRHLMHTNTHTHIADAHASTYKIFENFAMKLFCYCCCCCLLVVDCHRMRSPSVSYNTSRFTAAVAAAANTRIPTTDYTMFCCMWYVRFFFLLHSTISEFLLQIFHIFWCPFWFYFGSQLRSYQFLIDLKTINTKIMINDTLELGKIKSLTKCRSVGYTSFVNQIHDTIFCIGKTKLSRSEAESADQQKHRTTSGIRMDGRRQRRRHTRDRRYAIREEYSLTHTHPWGNFSRLCASSMLV